MAGVIFYMRFVTDALPTDETTAIGCVIFMAFFADEKKEEGKRGMKSHLDFIDSGCSITLLYDGRHGIQLFGRAEPCPVTLVFLFISHD